MDTGILLINDAPWVDAISALLNNFSLALPALESEAHGCAEVKTCCRGLAM
jgi:hypothetical protein